ncbi:hypothetical protein ACLMJK_001991 [Lecanora helva]
MPRQLSQALCDIIKSELQSGVDLQTLKSRHVISDKKARTMKKLFDETGEVVNTGARRAGSGRPKKLQSFHVERLRQFLAEHPEAFLKDMCLFMELEFGIELTESTMQRCCKRIGWSLKKQPRPRDELGFWMRTLPRDENGEAIRGVRPKTKRNEAYGTKLGYSAKRRLFEKTRQFVKDYMSQQHFDASHDYDHVQRVTALSLEILRVEQNTFRKIVFDGTVVELAAMMHDIDDRKYRAPAVGTDGYPSPPSNLDPHSQPISFDMNPDSLMQDQQQHTANIDPNLQNPPRSTVEAHLLQIGWPTAVTSKVAAITPFISYTVEIANQPGYAAALAQYPELAIVQDADRLDAIGAVGIGRAFTYGGAKEKERGLSDTMKHFEDKLAKLEGMMKTGEGRRLSVQRAERLRIFGKWWQDEMRLAGMLGADGMEWTKSRSPWVSQTPPTANPGPLNEHAGSPNHPNPPNQTLSTPNTQGNNQYQQLENSTMGGVRGLETQNEVSSLPITQHQDPAAQLLEAIGEPV